jgi:uracil-DNA glycosylase family 4
MLPSEHQRRAYLKALGIDVWLPRDEADPADEAPESTTVAEAPAAEGLNWSELRESVAQCKACVLHESRTQTVFGVGSHNADWMIIGEAPGAEEDRRGEPFIGRAGKLLDEMLRAVGQPRDKVFIANILKCRPPDNRDPKPTEAKACRSYLERQIALVRPKIILAVGKIAAQHMLGSDAPVGQMRGTVHQHGDIPLVVTYHPAYLLRSPTQKSKAWDDLCLASRALADATA